MLIACNTNLPRDQHEVQQSFRDQVRRSFDAVTICETSKQDSEGQKRCLRTMLNTVTAQAEGMLSYLMRFVANQAL